MILLNLIGKNALMSCMFSEKKRKTKRPEIGIYRPPSLLKQKNPVEDVDSGQQQLNEQGEIWEEEEHSTSSATNSKENSIEREVYQSN